MRLFNLRINPKKVQLIKLKIKILGHIIENGLIKPDPEKIEGIQKCPRPVTRKQMRSFLGMVSYYRNFIAHLAQIAGPLYKFCSEKKYPSNTIVWDAKAIEAFEEIKKRVIGLVLHTPCLNGDFTIQCDASGYGIGAVLLVDKENRLIPVSFISRNLKDPEKNYTVTEQELLAVVWAIEKFKPFIELTRFRVVTDHQALTWMQNLKDPKGRIGRWVLRLSGLSFDIGYKPGILNYVPDMLSRLPVQKDDSDFLPHVFAIANEEEIQLNKFPLFEEFTRDSLIEAQNEDEILKEIRIYLKTNKMNPELSVADKKKVIHAARNAFEMEDGLLVRYCNPLKMLEFLDAYNFERVMIPLKLQQSILRRMHDDTLSGHLGVAATFDRCQQRFYWPNMHNDVEKYVRTCHACQTSAFNQLKPTGLMNIKTMFFPWEKVSVDLIGPLPRTRNGCEFALVFIDTCTGWPEVFPMRSKKIKGTGEPKVPATSVAAKALTVFAHWGFPDRIVSDSGPQFASKLWTEVMKLLQIKAVFISPYQAQSNPVERKNKDIKSYLRKYVQDNHATWDQYIELLLCALRSAKITSTGLSPYEANFGRRMKMPIDLFLPQPGFKGNIDDTVQDMSQEIARRSQAIVRHLFENNELASIEQKLYYDPNRREVEYKIGDLVVLKAHALSNAAIKFSAKLGPKYEGPYILLKQTHPLTWELGDIHTKVPVNVTHVAQMKKYNMRDDSPFLSDNEIPGAKPDAKIRIMRPRARYGLGKQRGRLQGQPNKPKDNTPSVPLGQTDRVTRSQTKAQDSEDSEPPDLADYMPSIDTSTIDLIDDNEWLLPFIKQP